MDDFEDMKLDKKEISDIVEVGREVLRDELVDEYIHTLIYRIAKIIVANKPNKLKDDCEDK